MTPNRISILGGGPGGLYAARLLKLAFPGAHVEVHERGAATETFGFGVGIAPATQRNLADADADTFADILDASWAHEMSFRVGDRVVVAPNGDLRAIGRTTLLAVLQRHAVAAGVRLHFQSRAVASDLDADLILAADGVNSGTRETYAEYFQPRVVTSEGLYLWCGTDFALPQAVFSPVSTKYGTFVTHAYPYAADRSTFLIETDEATWRRAGFEATSAALADAPDGASDDVALEYLGKAFERELEGHRLIGNRTRWLRFKTVHCARWHHRNIVLLGDAAHTAHYSIGSGTKLAMEDAIALRQALLEAPDLESALTRYEATRRPPVEKLQIVARASEAWWDTLPERLHLSVERLFVAYMTRAGKVTLDRFAAQCPEIVRAALGAYAGKPYEGDGERRDDWILEGRVAEDAPAFSRLAIDASQTTPDGIRAVISRARELGGEGFLLQGPNEREHVLARLELGDRIKLATKKPVAIEAPAALRGELAAGLVSGRADLAILREKS